MMSDAEAQEIIATRDWSRMYWNQHMVFWGQYDPWVGLDQLVLIPLAYLSVIATLHMVMKYMTSASLEGPVMNWSMRIYNFTQICVCAYMVWGLGANVGFPNIFGYNSKPTVAMEWFILVHYWSKILDFVDTIFIVLRRKTRQLSFLHLFHHATILPIWGWILTTGAGNGTSFYGAFMNSLVHLVMYTHYLTTSFGFKNPFKKYITRFQLSQFVLCSVHSVLGQFLEYVMPVYTGWIQLSYQMIMLWMFTAFYNQTYKGRKTQKKVQ